MPDLKTILRGLPRLAVAFSGGQDSRFLCAMALAAGCDILALHAMGPHIPPRESEGAKAFAQALGLRLETVTIDPLTLDPEALASRERCYVCKTALLGTFRAKLRELGEEDRILCEGSHADDLKVYRPGMRALQENGVRSPLAEAGCTKAGIREEALARGIPLPKGKPRPCLLTRWDYGLRASRETLARLDAAEAELEALTWPDGRPVLDDFRLRLCPEPLLQTNGFDEAARPAVAEILARHGFSPFSVRVSEKVSGFYDRPRDAG